jgi:spore maturation protein CgeB
MPEQPKPLKILYAAALNEGSTARYRLEAFRRLGQEMIPFGVDAFDPQGRVANALRYRYPFWPLTAKINAALRKAAREHQPDVVWFDKPIYFNEKTIDAVKSGGAFTVCYNQDNPFGPRNDGCWKQFHKTFRFFDLHCLFRSVDVQRYADWGLPAVKLLFSYDPSLHFPPPAGWGDDDRTRALAYTGSPLEERPAFLAALGEQYGLPLSVAGPRWEQAWPDALKQKYLVGGMMKGPAYRESMWHSKVNLAFVTRMNEDDIAHKSVEIAACAQFLLAERSPGHLEAFEEGKEAEFYSSVGECAEKARYYLDHPEQRELIAAAGRLRVERSGYSNDAQIAKVLERVQRMRGA